MLSGENYTPHGPGRESREKPRMLSDMYTLHTTSLSNIITEITLIWQQLYKNVPPEMRKHVKKMTNLLALADRILVDELPDIAASITNQEQHIDKLHLELKSRKPVLYSPGRWKFVQKSWIRQGLSPDSHIVRVIHAGEVFDVGSVIEYNGRVRGQVEEGFITLHSLERNIAFVTKDVQDIGDLESYLRSQKEDPEKIPDVIFVTGRVGFNSAMNGAYQKGSNLHDGYPYFQNKDNGWVMRYFRGRWMFDWRGCESDDISAAVLRTDAPHPGVGDQIWKVFDGRRWMKDPNIQCRGVTLPTSPLKSDDAKRTPQKSKTRKRQPSRIGAFFSSFLGSGNKRNPAREHLKYLQKTDGLPRSVAVSGREGYNAAINGIYQLGEHLHNERVFYTRENPDGEGAWYIRWRPIRKMWLIDLREDGLPEGDEGHCQAFCRQDVKHPALLTDIWKVWDVDEFTEDVRVKLQRDDEEEEVQAAGEPNFALPEHPGFNKRVPAASPRTKPVPLGPTINLSARKASRKRHARTASAVVRRKSAFATSNPLANALKKKEMHELPIKTRHNRSLSITAKEMRAHKQLTRVKSLGALDEDDLDAPSNLVRLEDAELWGGAALEKQEQEMLEELAKLKVAPLAKTKSEADLLKHAKAIEQDLLHARDQKLAVILAKEEKVKRLLGSDEEHSDSEDSIIESHSAGDLEFGDEQIAIGLGKKDIIFRKGSDIYRRESIEEDDTLTEDSQMTEVSDHEEDVLSEGVKPQNSPKEPIVEQEALEDFPSPHEKQLEEAPSTPKELENALIE